MGLSPGLDWTPTCEDMVLLVAVGVGLQASSGCRSGMDATVCTRKQAAPSNSVDSFTPKCIEGLADLLGPCGLRAIGKQPVRKDTGLAQRYTGTWLGPLVPQHHHYLPCSRDHELAQARTKTRLFHLQVAPSSNFQTQVETLGG